MYKEIIIGVGDDSCSAIKCFEIKGNHSISENNYWYWISGLIFDVRMKIKKDTKEGIKLKKMIDENKPLPQILYYLNTIVIKNSTPNDVLEAIKEEKEKSFEEGRNSLREDYKTLLRIS